jgi:hypothetical protein
MKIICTYLYITCNKKTLFVKKILSYCGYSPTSPFFLLLSEHKHCDNAATNSNSEDARSRMVASLWGSVNTGTKEDESSTGRTWAAGFHHVNGPFLLGVHFKTYEPFLSCIVQFFFSGRGQPRIRRSTCIIGDLFDIADKDNKFPNNINTRDETWFLYDRQTKR